jgi:hypothetical protein
MAALMLVVMMTVIMTMFVDMLLRFMFVLMPVVGMSLLDMLMLVFMLLVGMATHLVSPPFLNKYNSQLFKFQDKILFFSILLPCTHPPCNFQSLSNPFFEKCKTGNPSCK